jgi:integration host factor subunit beta
VNKSHIVERVALDAQTTRELAIRLIDGFFEAIAARLAAGGRVELRGFGSFSIRQREARDGRNPYSGAHVDVEAKRVPHFKPGREIRTRVNASRSAAG